MRMSDAVRPCRKRGLRKTAETRGSRFPRVPGRAAESKGKHLPPGGCRARFLTVIVAYGSVPLMEEFLT